MAIKVFCCYAREDEALLRRLRTQLIPLQRKGLIEVWYDGEISAGTKWEAELHKQLNIAQVILFLVSPHFISSDYCYDDEVREAIKRHEKGEAYVIPVILSPVHWQETPFGQLQALPKNAKPLTSWRNRNEAIFNVVDGIRRIVYELSPNSEAITETTSKPTLSPNDDDPDPPLTEDRDSSERDYVEEKIADSGKYKNKSFEERRILAAQLLESNHPLRALEQLQNLLLTHAPPSVRWRITALRGQCYFNMRELVAAQKEFHLAYAILPEYVPPEQQMEALLLRLHLAEASRELGQYETAYKQFLDSRSHMDDGTPLRLVAQAQWGMSLILYEQAYKFWNEAENGTQQDQLEEKKVFLELMQQSLDYAENACTLYKTINELSRSALMKCQIALIEQAMENLDAARIQLKKVLDEWSPTLKETGPDTLPEISEKVKRYSMKECANIVSASACYLASVEFDAKQCDTALMYIDIALKAGAASYIMRRADAYMTKGQILAACNDEGASFAFRQALKELERTDRLGAKIRVHRMLGAYLIKQGKDKEGNAELDKALRLANIPSTYTTANEEEAESRE